VIANPKSGTASELERIEEKLRSREGTEILSTEAPGHARELGRRAAEEGVPLVVAAGGDGTIHEVVNGIAPGFERTSLGVLPLGTGNDLARTLGIPLDPMEALEALFTGREERLDLIDAGLENGRSLLAVNAVAGGFSGQVTEKLSSDRKERFGSLAFLIGAGEALAEAVPFHVELDIDGTSIEEPSTLGVVVANGRSAAGGLQIAPGANPADGLLDVIVLRYGNAIELAGLAARLLTGDILASGCVSYHPATEIGIQATPAMPFNADGELLDAGPRRLRVARQRLKVRGATLP
jgi:diacylglycerol kinase (ATP)